MEREITGSDTGSADGQRATGARRMSSQKFVSSRVVEAAPVGTEPKGRIRGDPAVTTNVIGESRKYS